jgi:hypothetical protein
MVCIQTPEELNVNSPGWREAEPGDKQAKKFSVAREPFEQCNSVNIAAQTFSLLKASCPNLS